VELQFYGGNCLRITTKKAQIVVDDNLAELGLKSITKPTDINLRTFAGVPAHKSAFEANMPGEYEIADVAIHGVAARAHMDVEGKTTATIFTIESGDQKVAVLGHIYPDLSEEQLEAIGMVDVLVVPVGNSGYTMDGVGALKLIKQIEPKLVIPTHFADKAIKYEVPQVELAEALKNMSMEPTETVEKYKAKPGELSDTTHLVILERV
jgi:L-ascorbate metabolism protein UlaG (beta-lactamase superfamily)